MILGRETLHVQQVRGVSRWALTKPSSRARLPNVSKATIGGSGARRRAVFVPQRQPMANIVKVKQLRNTAARSQWACTGGQVQRIWPPDGCSRNAAAASCLGGGMSLELVRLVVGDTVGRQGEPPRLFATDAPSLHHGLCSIGRRISLHGVGVVIQPRVALLARQAARLGDSAARLAAAPQVSALVAVNMCLIARIRTKSVRGWGSRVTATITTSNQRSIPLPFSIPRINASSPRLIITSSPTDVWPLRVLTLG